MEAIGLGGLGAQLLDRATEGKSGRAAHTVTGGSGRMLGQTIIAMLAGHELSEHENPGEATVQVLRGRVVLKSSSGSAELTAGEFASVPDERHSLAATEDSVFLLTAVHLSRRSVEG